MPHEWLHVAAAVITDRAGRILIARRPAHLHQGGLWEFPGGKLEEGEGAREALVRELHEELGIDLHDARPLIRVRHAYPDRKVLLDVWRVDRYGGEPLGREGQPLRWVAPEELSAYSFPAADLPVLTAVRLPDRYLITPDPGPRDQWAEFLNRLERRLLSGIRLIQFRAKGLEPEPYGELARRVVTMAEGHGARVLLNAPAQRVAELGAHGLHLTSAALSALRGRPLPRDRWVAASCHSLSEVEQAVAAGCDFVVLSPVRATASHPDTPPLGWQGFRRLTEAANLPAYALGGMEAGDLAEAWRNGGQGIAAIRGLWEREEGEDE